MLSKYIIFFIISLFSVFQMHSQSDEIQLKNIYELSLTNGKSYKWLEYLSNSIGGRLSGSLNADKAVYYTKSELDSLNLDRVWLQPVMVPKWVRGNPEFAYIETAPGKTISVNICALGGSVSTPIGGIKAQLLEVSGIKELQALNDTLVMDKIVFFNRPMQASEINTFKAYGKCVDQRYEGAKEAAKKGALAVIVRSMNLRIDNFPHTGVMSYGDLPIHQRIPAAAISTRDAELLSGMLAIDDSFNFYFKQNCKQLKDVKSHNVIAEIKGSEFPDEIILVGGHLDSWDLGDGSHDDGAGCVQSMEVLHLLKLAGIQPKRTIRVVLFMNEENGGRGASVYNNITKAKGENHIFALESDSGGFTPRGFKFEGDPSKFAKVLSWKNLFEPYLIHYFKMGGSGADISQLNNGENLLAGLFPDSQRYFDFHHAANDTFDAINKRELELGAASMTALVYLIDKYGW